MYKKLENDNQEAIPNIQFNRPFYGIDYSGVNLFGEQMDFSAFAIDGPVVNLPMSFDDIVDDREVENTIVVEERDSLTVVEDIYVKEQRHMDILTLTHQDADPVALTSEITIVQKIKHLQDNEDVEFVLHGQPIDFIEIPDYGFELLTERRFKAMAVCAKDAVVPVQNTRRELLMDVAPFYEGEDILYCVCHMVQGERVGIRISRVVAPDHNLIPYWARMTSLGEFVMTRDSNVVQRLGQRNVDLMTSFYHCDRRYPDSAGFIFNIDTIWYYFRRETQMHYLIEELVPFLHVEMFPLTLSMSTPYTLKNLTERKILISEDMVEVENNLFRSYTTTKKRAALEIRVRGIATFGEIMTRDLPFGHHYFRGNMSTFARKPSLSIFVKYGDTIYSLSRQKKKQRRLVVTRSLLNSIMGEEYFRGKFVIFHETTGRNDPYFTAADSTPWICDAEKYSILRRELKLLEQLSARRISYLLDLDLKILKKKIRGNLVEEELPPIDFKPIKLILGKKPSQEELPF